MKILHTLITLLVLFAAPFSWASTPVSGDVDDQLWTAAGSPYLVIGDVSVGSLVIQPGVEVQFQGNYHFQVPGVLQVRGTAGNEVRFTTTNAAVGWQGICFDNGGPGSFLNHAIIEYSKNSGVRITNSAPAGGGVPAFTNCTIINNSSPVFGGGIDARLRSGDLVLDNCDLRNNTCGVHGGGINAILTTGTLKMVGCTVVSNTANVAQSLGYYVGGGVRVSGHSLLLNCFFGDNLSRGHYLYNASCGGSYGGGVYSDTGDATFRNCRFQRNTADTLSESWADSVCAFSRGGAVYFRDGHLTMQNCIVDTNTCSGAYHDNQGAGVCVESGTAEIINCTIVANNTTGIYNFGGTVKCLNSILDANNSGAAQIAGTATATYSDIQGGYPGEGNKSIAPLLQGGTLALRSTSPCIDAGNPDPRYNDSCLPPSRGTAINDMGAYGGPAACCWLNPCGPPVITSQPKSLNACINSSAILCVTAIGDEPLRYQWYFHGTDPANVPVVVAGATNACLTISNVQSNNAGYYSVRVANALDTADSTTALLTVTPVCVGLNLYPGLSLTGGVVGQVYRVEYALNPSDTTWTTLTTVTQEVSGVFVLDPQPARDCDSNSSQAVPPRRFYRVIP